MESLWEADDRCQGDEFALIICVMTRLPSKLEDSANHGQGTELLIVEGDSAARAIKRLRDHQWQAILPMQGKPMNAIKASRSSVAGNELFRAFIDAPHHERVRQHQNSQSE